MPPARPINFRTPKPRTRDARGAAPHTYVAAAAHVFLTTGRRHQPARKASPTSMHGPATAGSTVDRHVLRLSRSTRDRARGLRLIIAYKLTRAAASLFAAALLAASAAADRTAPLQTVAEQVRGHATSAWSIALADALVSAVAPRHLWLVAGALALDAAFTFVEGWALHRSWWWGRWLVVIATLGFLPFEVIAIVRHADAGRVLLLGLNSLVALYLARRARDRGAAGG